MRVLCSAVSGPGHAYPMLAIASALRERNHDVVVALEERHRAAASGFAFVAFPMLPAPAVAEFRPFDIAGQIARSFLPIVKKLQPDVAVIDLLTLGVALACEVNGVPFASLFVHPLHLPSSSLAPFGQGKPPARTAIGAYMQRHARKRQLVDFQRGADDCNDARAKLDLARIDRIDVAFSQSLVLVATLPALEPPRIDWPEHAHVVGPCLFEPPAVDPGDPSGAGPLVLIAASTAHEGQLLDASIQAVRAIGARAIVTTGASSHREVSADSDVFIVSDAPHGVIARRASAIVCNGGHGIVARALSAGVPLVVLPQHGDQKENAARAERLGAAIWIRKPQDVAKALARVLSEPGFRTAAKRVAESVAEINGPRNAAVLIEDWAQKQREAGWCPPPSRTEV